MGRKNSDWQILCVRDVQVLFLKIMALFWYFFCSISFVKSIYLLLSIKKSCLFWHFSHFAGMACAREAKDSRESISTVLFIVNCELKVGNSFLHTFSHFLSFTEILDTFDFFCLRCFSLTDLFLYASEMKKTTTTRRVSIFSDDKETFLKRGEHKLTSSSKAAPEPSKKP